MTVSIMSNTALPAVTVAHQPRLDQSGSAAVERGLQVQRNFNTMCAFEYLKSHNIATSVIERVLLHPELRRNPAH